MRIRIAFLSLALLFALAIVAGQVADAQLLLVTGTYTVTELRPDKGKIGVGLGDTGETRNWVEVNSRTRTSTNGVVIPNSEVWQRLKRGTKFKVHGGRDISQHIVAKQIWF